MVRQLFWYSVPSSNPTSANLPKTHRNNTLTKLVRRVVTARDVTQGVTLLAAMPADRVSAAEPPTNVNTSATERSRMFIS